MGLFCKKKRTITPSTDVNKKRKGDETIFIKFTMGADIKRTINGIILPSRNKLDMETGKTSRKSREVKYKIQKEEYKLPIEYVPIRKVDLQLLIDELESMRELLSELQNEKDEFSAQLEAAQLEHVEIQKGYEFTIVALERKKEELQVKIENNKNVCEIGMKLMSISETTKAKTTIAGAHLYNHALGIMPRTSIESLSMGSPILVAAFLATLGITDLLEDPADIANACPSVSTLHKYLGMAREDALMSIAECIKAGRPLCLLHDKKKAGIERLIAQFATYNLEQEKVIVQTIGADGSLGSDDDVALALEWIFAWVDVHLDDEQKMKVNGQSTDAGGGGLSS